MRAGSEAMERGAEGTGELGSARNEPAAGASRIRATRLEQALDWAAGLAPAPMRFATACCGMGMVQGGDPFEHLGTAPPAVSSRAADLLIVAGTLTRRQVPLILELYERMLAPRWVIAWGACAAGGGPYDNYATVSGLSRILPVESDRARLPAGAGGAARGTRAVALR